MVDLLREARGVKAAKEEEARLGGNEGPQMAWFVITLVCSGFGVPDGVPMSMLDNGRFGFAPEKVEETFRQVYRH